MTIVSHQLYMVKIHRQPHYTNIFSVGHDKSTHINEWTAECKRLGISITAKDAIDAIAAYQGIRLDTQTQSRPQFTPVRFINALVEFIVATDQV